VTSVQTVAGELTIEGGDLAAMEPVDLQMSVRERAGVAELVLVLSPQTTWVVSADSAEIAYIAGALAAHSGVAAASGQRDVERGMASYGRVLRERDEAVKRFEDFEELLVDLFNPRDDDSETAETIVEAAAKFIEGVPCKCTPEDVADHDACERCEVLGRLGDRPVGR